MSKLREFFIHYGAPLLLVVVVFAVVIVCCNVLSDRSIMGDENTVVSLMVDCKRAVAGGIRGEESFAQVIPENGYVLKIHDREIRGGSTLDSVIIKVLQENNIPCDIREGQIFDIIGLESGHLGSDSGWLCLVNGHHVEIALADYHLKNGDYIELMYVTDYNEFL